MAERRPVVRAYLSDRLDKKRLGFGTIDRTRSRAETTWCRSDRLFVRRDRAARESSYRRRLSNAVRPTHPRRRWNSHRRSRMITSPAQAEHIINTVQADAI